jgi:hypothetical protein
LASQLGFGDDPKKMKAFIDAILGKSGAATGGGNGSAYGSGGSPSGDNPYGF